MHLTFSEIISSVNMFTSLSQLTGKIEYHKIQKPAIFAAFLRKKQIIFKTYDPLCWAIINVKKFKLSLNVFNLTIGTHLLR